MPVYGLLCPTRLLCNCTINPDACMQLMGSRSWSENEVMSRGKQLEVQLVRKEQEIAALKTRLTQYISSNHMAESNMAVRVPTSCQLVPSE